MSKIKNEGNAKERFNPAQRLMYLMEREADLVDQIRAIDTEEHPELAPRLRGMQAERAERVAAARAWLAYEQVAVMGKCVVQERGLLEELTEKQVKGKVVAGAAGKEEEKGGDAQGTAHAPPQQRTSRRMRRRAPAREFNDDMDLDSAAVSEMKLTANDREIRDDLFNILKLLEGNPNNSNKSNK
eukprot:TRINITY_DN15901_c0_g1_i1.p2 TRINITY_DN15901_c0_g1~~TRINITY_DN15901_c0_g1_i1.p2  ORF type:complete len:185 (-),score=44.75 TRINITY_DN15901_c0_g1_i1:8-562(-)